MVTINPIIVSNSNHEISRSASRTTGVAPLSVFFTSGFSSSSESNREFTELDYTWNFNDAQAGEWANSGKSKNSAKGAVASHVFENPGIYTVNLTVRDTSGIIDSDTIMITVLDPNDFYSNTNTTCVSDTVNSNFEGCPVGANRLTTNNIADISNYAASNRRILLHRGSSWTSNRRVSIPSRTTSLHIGAYGSCESPNLQGICDNAPQINMTGSEEFIIVDRAHDLRITDITLTGESTNAGVITGAIDIQRLLMLRVKSTGFYDGIIWSNWREDNSHLITENAIVSCNISETERLVTFIGGDKLTYMGNVAFNSKTSHVTRIWNSYQGVIAHNSLSGASYTNAYGLHALKFHGATESQIGSYSETGANGLPHRTKFTIISDNIFGSSGPWPVVIAPQNDISDENLSDIIVEKNKFISSFGTQGETLVTTGLKFGGQYITVRNNIFDGSGNQEGYRGIVIERSGIEAPPHGNHIYNNTIYKAGNSVWTYEGILIDETASDTVVINNFVSFPDSDNQLLITDYSGDITMERNILNRSHGFVDPSNVEPLLRDFSLLSWSPAVNQGMFVPVFDDFKGLDRNGSYSLGAHHH